MDTTGKLMLISMQNTQLECGSERLFFNLNYQHWSDLVTPTWHTNLWEYCDTKAVGIDMELPIIYEKPRLNDKFIMDVLHASNKFEVKELKEINKVRQYLRILTLADVADLRGKRLLQAVKRPEELVKVRKSSLQFLPQSPLQSWFNCWAKRACPILERHLSGSPVGKWIGKGHQIWEWQLNGKKNVLRWNGGFYEKGKKAFHRITMPDGFEADKESWIDVDVGFVKGGAPYVVVEGVRFDATESDVGEDNKQLFKNYENTWGNIEYLLPEQECLKLIWGGDVHVATDGSNKGNEGVQGWVIAKLNGQIFVRGRGRIKCARADASSLRPEILAILAVTSFILYVVQDNETEGVQKPKLNMTIYTDSENAITSLSDSLYPTTKNVFENNMDVKIEAKHILRTSPVQFHLQHVYAHQDENTDFDQLPLEAQLNCLVDEYVGLLYSQENLEPHDEVSEFFLAQKCSLKLPFTRPTSNILEQIIAFRVGHQSEQQLSTFWNTPYQWMCNIEWKGLRSAIRREKHGNKVNMCKLVHKQWPTMYMLERNGMSTTDVCPMCMNNIETWDHVFQCKSDDAIMEKNSQLNLLQKKLKQYYTHPVLRRRLMAAVMQWTGGHTITHPKEDGQYQEIDEALRDQCNLKFENIFCGVMSHKFSWVQNRYYEENARLIPKRRLCGHEWSVKVVRAFMEYSKNVWRNRCDIVHEGHKLSLENQVRASALKLRQHLRCHPWEMRMEDGYLLKKPIKFFSSSSIVNLRFWIRSINVSREIALHHEQTTRQDIRKWLDVPETPIGKTIRGFKKGKMKFETRRKRLQLQLSTCWKKHAEEQSDKACEEGALNHGSETPIIAGCIVNKGGDESPCDWEDSMVNEEISDELSLWDDIRSVRAFDEYSIGTESVEPMQMESISNQQSVSDYNQESHETARIKDDDTDTECIRPPVVYQDGILQVGVLRSNRRYDKTPLIADDAPKKDNDRCMLEKNTSAPKMLGAMKDWFVKKLGVWKEPSNRRRASFSSEEIIFVEESENLGNNSDCDRLPIDMDNHIYESDMRSQESEIFDEKYCSTVRKPVHDEYKDIGRDISSSNSIDETIEYETILESALDIESDSSSECVETFEAYFHDRCGIINPVRDMLNNLSGQNVRKYDWKEYLKPSYRYRCEKAYNKNAEVPTYVYSSNITSVIDEVDESIGDVECVEERNIKVPYRKQQRPFRLQNKHKRSVLVEKLLEEVDRDAQLYDEQSVSTEVSALMIPLEEISEIEAIGEGRNEGLGEKGIALSTELQQCATCRLNQNESLPQHIPDIGASKVDTRRSLEKMLNEDVETQIRRGSSECRPLQMPCEMNVKNGKCKHARIRENENKIKPWRADKSTIINIQEGEAFTVQSKGGSKVAKNMQRFFHQVKEVDEAYLQQRKDVYDAKTRDRDPFTGRKRLPNEPDALHQAQSKLQGYEQPKCSTSMIMQISNKVIDKQNGHDNKQAAFAGKNLAFINEEHRNDGRVTYHMVGSMSTDTGGAILDPRDVICTKNILNFSKPRGNGSTMENEMTSDFEENYFCDTGLEVGIGCENINSPNGNLDVCPSTYPTGRPKNYFIMLDKTHTQS